MVVEARLTTHGDVPCVTDNEVEAAILTNRLPLESKARACNTLPGFLPMATVPVGVAFVVPSGYWTSDEAPPVMLTLSEEPVAVSGTLLAWIFEVTVPLTEIV